MDTSFLSSAQAVPVAGQGVSDVTAGIASGKGFNAWSGYDKAVFTLAVSSATAGSFQVNGVTVNLTSANVASAPTLAGVLSGFINLQKGYYATVSSNVLTVYTVPVNNGPSLVANVATVSGSGTTFPALAQGLAGTPATGITWTTVSTPHDVSYYLNPSATTAALTPFLIGNAHAYVLTEKMN